MRHKRRAIAEINVVPYIDVTLVLLIIFMITTPLLNLGVDVDLPESEANTVSIDEEPVVINVDANGRFYLSIGGESRPIDADNLEKKLAAFVKANPKVPIIIGADQGVEYGRVYQAMVVAQHAGAKKVGLISDPLPVNK